MTINPAFFPAPDSAYASNGQRFDKYASISILAWNIQLMSAGGGLYGKAEHKKGYVFYRDSGVPLPRPATQLAWERLCRLGHRESRSFLVPFLPSLRDEDEMGQAIAERGIRVPSLSRRSPLHVRERATTVEGRSFESIVWGDIYLGRVGDSRTINNILVGAVDRSNIVEALVAPRDSIWPATAQDSIRTRLEFIAQYGVPALFEFGKTAAAIPIAHRVLFQFLSQADAASWALAYNSAWHRIRQDPGLIEADWKDMIEDMQESLAAKESQETEERAAEQKKTQKAGFGDSLSSLSL